MLGKYAILRFCLTVSTVVAQQGDRVDLGRLQTGATVSFVCYASGKWGIEISGGTTPRLTQQKPAQIEIFRGGENVQQPAVGYQSVQRKKTQL
jgi:hypothetical protein